MCKAPNGMASAFGSSTPASSVPALVGLLGRTSDRTAGSMRGADALARALSHRLGVTPELIGRPAEARTLGWKDDLINSRPLVLAAARYVDSALSAARVPVTVAGECAVGLGTLPVVARRRSDARVLYLDAHGDFNTPATTRSGYLGGLSLAGACGLWDSGLGAGLPSERVILAGVRDLDPAERDLLERESVTVLGAGPELLGRVREALSGAPVYVHIDLDVLDPTAFPVEYEVEGGPSQRELRELLAAVVAVAQLVGFEVAEFEAPEDPLERAAATSAALALLEPLAVAATNPRTFSPR
jgi:arginase